MISEPDYGAIKRAVNEAIARVQIQWVRDDAITGIDEIRQKLQRSGLPPICGLAPAASIAVQARNRVMSIQRERIEHNAIASAKDPRLYMNPEASKELIRILYEAKGIGDGGINDKH